jgi:lipopolysaccharide transport system permease protein
VRYRGSALGFLWTFLNPLLTMAVYSLVFSVYMRNPMKNYTGFLFVGLLPWIWFSTAMTSGTSSISDRRDLINKVKFPPQLLPAVVIGSAFCNYLLSLPLMVLLLLVSGNDIRVHVLWFPLIALLQLVFSTGLVYVTSSINVVFRDLQHIVVNLLQFVFFLTPVIYSVEQIPEKYREMLLLLNPMATLVGSYQDIFFYGREPNWRGLLVFAGLAWTSFFLGSHFLGARRESFAESV